MLWKMGYMFRKIQEHLPLLNKSRGHEDEASIQT